MSKVFAPQWFGGKTKIRMIRNGSGGQYNWYTRSHDSPPTFKLNHVVLSRIHRRLHYLAYHAPLPIRVQWAPKCAQFEKVHFGVQQLQSVRFMTKHTMGSWC